MRIIFYILVTAVGALVTWGFSLLILRLSHRYRLYPKIRSRDVHTRPTPRLGGVAMFFGVLAATGVAALVPALKPIFADTSQIIGILIAALIIVVMGVVDDIWTSTGSRSSRARSSRPECSRSAGRKSRRSRSAESSCRRRSRRSSSRFSLWCSS